MQRRRSTLRCRPPTGAAPNNGPPAGVLAGPLEENEDQAAPSGPSNGPIRALAEVLMDLRAARREKEAAKVAEPRTKVRKARAAPTRVGGK
jgi:hypothetical protein